MFCVPSVLFATRIIHAFTEYTITFIFIAAALSAHGWGCLLIPCPEVPGGNAVFCKGTVLSCQLQDSWAGSRRVPPVCSIPGWQREGWVLDLGCWFRSELLLKFQGTTDAYRPVPRWCLSVRAAVWRDAGVSHLDSVKGAFTLQPNQTQPESGWRNNLRALGSLPVPQIPFVDKALNANAARAGRNYWCYDSSQPT